MNARTPASQRLSAFIFAACLSLNCLRVLAAEPSTIPSDATAAHTQPSEVEVPPVPDVAPAGTAADDPGPLFFFESKVIGSLRTTNVKLQGRTSVVMDGPNGIDITISGWVNGAIAVRHFKAKDSEELRRLAPKWYQFWSDTGAGTGLMILHTQSGPTVVRGNQIIFKNGAPFAGAIAMPSDDLAQLRSKINFEMSESKLTSVQRTPVLEQLERVQVAHDDVGAGGSPNIENQRYLDECDALRRQLADAGLSDPGTLLPPPANSRLGVTVETAREPGVEVNSVIDGSRANKMGVQPNDIIKTMNNQPINDITDLRKIVMASQQLTLTVNRNGQEVTLREAAATQPVK
jgi:hypothetical protein